MKKLSAILIFSLSVFLAPAQEDAFSIGTPFNPLSVSQMQLETATSLSDIYEIYPNDWVAEYVSVEVKTVVNGMVNVAKGKSGDLNQEQQSILRGADVGSMVSVVVDYFPNNDLSHNDMHKMDFACTVLPFAAAQFPGGEKAMNTYLQENIIDAIGEDELNKVPWVNIQFVVNEEGNIVNVHTLQSSGLIHIDGIIITALSQMPQWTPATSADGKTFEQKFQFSFGNGQGC